MNKLSISIVICTYNRDKFLPESLDSLTKQTVDNDFFEILIIDNNSTDKTETISKNFIENNPQLNIKYHFEANKGLSFARNRGIKEACSPIIAYVDDDAILTPDYIKNILTFFASNPQAMGAGGEVIPKYESGEEPIWNSKYVSAMSGKVNHGNLLKKYTKAMKYPVGCNMIYKKEILVKAGGFNNQLTFRSDDKYIFHQIHKLTDEIYYIPNATLYHYIDEDRLSFESFKKLYLKSGNEEKKRIKSENSGWGLFKKFIELVFKLAASVALYFKYLFKGQAIKGQYIVAAMWFTLVGFFKKEIFVR